MEDYQLPKGGEAMLHHLPGRGQREVCAVGEDYCVPIYYREWCCSYALLQLCVCLSRLPTYLDLAITLLSTCVAVISAYPSFL